MTAVNTDMYGKLGASTSSMVGGLTSILPILQLMHFMKQGGFGQQGQGQGQGGGAPNATPAASGVAGGGALPSWLNRGMTMQPHGGASWGSPPANAQGSQQLQNASAPGWLDHPLLWGLTGGLDGGG